MNKKQKFYERFDNLGPWGEQSYMNPLFQTRQIHHIRYKNPFSDGIQVIKKITKKKKLKKRVDKDRQKLNFQPVKISLILSPEKQLPQINSSDNLLKKIHQKRYSKSMLHEKKSIDNDANSKLPAIKMRRSLQIERKVYVIKNRDESIIPRSKSICFENNNEFYKVEYLMKNELRSNRQFNSNLDNIIKYIGNNQSSNMKQSLKIKLNKLRSNLY